MAKITPLLENRLREAKPGDLLEVVIEVPQIPPQAAATRAERAAASERAFGASTKDLTQLIDSVGGQVLASTWLGSAIKARLPVESIERLRALDSIDLIDLPHQLTRG